MTPLSADLPAETVTGWLRKWRGGDVSALDELTEVLYRDLRRLARHYLRQERPDHTLQATALVHEAYLHVRSLQHLNWEDRAHFVGVVAQVMRHVLVDHARQHDALKRGGGLVKVPLTDAESVASPAGVDLVALNEAMEHLAGESPRKARVIELFYFGGLTAKEIADVLRAGDTSVSQRTVEGDLQIGRAKLYRWLHSTDQHAHD